MDNNVDNNNNDNKDINDDANDVKGYKSVDNSIGDITLEQFKNALENNIECKGYFDSLCDKTVNIRLDKGIESWKDKNLQTIIENEINKRYPQKTESELRFEEQQKALEKAQEEKRQLQLQIKYQDLMAKNNLPIDILDFVSGKDIESTITNIERFKGCINKLIDERVKAGIIKKIGNSAYTPPGNNGFSPKTSMWG